MMKLNLFSLLIILLVFSCQNIPNKNNKISESPLSLEQVSNLLDSIHVEDQKYRAKLNGIEVKFGADSPQMKNHWEKIRKTDSSNLVVVKRIIEKYGWLSSNEIGDKANTSLFLVIQHSDLKTQEKYLPILRKAVKENKANSQSLALLEDRINLGNGELQIYGSQIGFNQETGENYVLPMIEPEKINERRKNVGLMSIESYTSNFGMIWDLDKYKQNLPNYIKKLHEKK